MTVESFVNYIIDNPRWILIGLGSYSVIYALSFIFTGPKSSKNPFAFDERKKKKPMVIDQQARDAVLKQRFKPNNVPENLDAIIIGSGAGGLTTAILLGRAGKKVLVLEQHDQAGGCCHTFVEKGYEFDTGIHYIGDMNNSRSRALLDQITEGQLDWTPMDSEFDTVVLGDAENIRRYPMVGNKNKYFENLITLFPEEEKAIRKYAELILAADKSFMGIVMLKAMPKKFVWFLVKTGLVHLFFSCFKYTSVTLQEILDSHTENKDLKCVLSYICGDYGVSPKEVPFIMHAILIRHYWNGAYYPVGGPSEIAFQMVRAVEQSGGQVLVQAPVTDILFNSDGRAVGVRVSRSSGGVDLKAKYIISDAGVMNTFKKLLPQDIAKKSCIYPVINRIGPSISFLSVFVGIDGSSKDLKLPSGNTWYYVRNDINKVMDNFLSLSLEDVTSASFPFLYISFPSAKDSAWENRHPGKSSVLIITLANWKWFQSWENERQGHRGETYEGIKQTIGTQIWGQCCQLFPQLDGQKEYMDVGTPLTNKYYLGAPMGEMYGLDQGKSRFTPETIATLRADTDIPGLYLTGQDTLLCGFTSVVYAGLLCAAQILHRNVWKDFNNQRNALLKEEQEKVKEKMQAE